MSENTNKDIFVILQKVLDKLKTISEDTQNNNVKTDEIHNRNNKEVSEVLSRVVKNLMLTDRLIESSRNPFHDLGTLMIHIKIPTSCLQD